MSGGGTWRARAAELFGIDLRSLALLRIGVGALLLVDLAQRAVDLRAHYTDGGVVPRRALEAYGPDAVFTLHALASGSALAVGALFGLAAVCGVALLLGWRTRLATLASWLLLASLQWRNPPLNHGGDVMLRMLLFWGMFLPLGARLSLDARGRDPTAPGLHVSAASAALLLQVAFVYAFAVAQRTGPVWWEGDALFYALHYDLFATGFAAWLRQFESILPPLSMAVLWMEILGPVVAFSPVWTAPLRCLAVVAFWGLHLGIGLSLSLGLFPAVFVVAWLAFVPPLAWQRLGRWPGGAGRVASRLPALLDVGVALLLALAFLCNGKHVFPGWIDRNLPAGWDAPARWLRIDQRWGLLAPDPPRYDGWYVIAGHLDDGREVDLLDPPKPLSRAKPERVSGQANIRWRRFLLDLALQRDDPRWRDLGSYHCRAWNERRAGGARLDRVNVHSFRETTTPRGPERGEVLLLLAHRCPR